MSNRANNKKRTNDSNTPNRNKGIVTSTYEPTTSGNEQKPVNPPKKKDR